MPTSDSFRGFFAVPFSPSTTGALEAAARERLGTLPGSWRATPAERIHLTLKFLGEVGLDLVPRLEEALRAAAGSAAPFPLELGGWVLLPGKRDPRVLAVGVSDPTGTLPRLAALLTDLPGADLPGADLPGADLPGEERAAALGFPREARPFRAHVTVARITGAGGARQTPAGGGVPPPASGKSYETIAAETVGRVVLLRSTLGPEGPTYSVVAEASLGGPGGGGQAGSRIESTGRGSSR